MASKKENFQDLGSGIAETGRAILSWFTGTAGGAKKAGGGIINHSTNGVGFLGRRAQNHPNAAAAVVLLAAIAPITWIYKKFKAKQEHKAEQTRMQNLEDATYNSALREQIAAERALGGQRSAMLGAANPATGNVNRVQSGRGAGVPGQYQ